MSGDFSNNAPKTHSGVTEDLRIASQQQTLNLQSWTFCFNSKERLGKDGLDGGVMSSLTADSTKQPLSKITLTFGKTCRWFWLLTCVSC